MVDGPPRGNHDKATIMRKFIGLTIGIGLLLYAISQHDQAYGATLTGAPAVQEQHHATD